jgi:cysteine desulfurase
MNEMEGKQREYALRDKLETSLIKLRRLISMEAHNIAYPCYNISFKYVEGEGLLMGFNSDIAVSSGSACTSASRTILCAKSSWSW